MSVRPLLGRRPLIDRLADRHDPLVVLLFEVMPTALVWSGVMAGCGGATPPGGP